MPLRARPIRPLAVVALFFTVLAGCGEPEGAGAGGDEPTAASTASGTTKAGVTSSTQATQAASSTGATLDPMANPILTDVPPNGALDLGAYACDQPTDNPAGCKAVTDYGKLLYDPVGHQLLMWGGGHAGNYASNVVRFDFDTLGWSAVSPSTSCERQVADNFDPITASWKDTGAPTARHTWDMMSLAEVNGVRAMVILTSGGIGGYESCNVAGASPPVPASGKLMWYDVENDAWSFGTTAADTLWYYASSQETDPVSKKILVFATAQTLGLHLYDPATQTVSDVATDFSGIDAGALGYSNNLVYFPPNDRFYYLTRGTPVNVYEVALDRASLTAKVTRVDAPDPPDNPEETGWAYDSVHQIIGGGVLDGVFHAFDPAAGTWTSRNMDIAPGGGTAPRVAFHALDFDPVDGVFLFVTAPDPHTWAYRFDGVK